MKSVRKIIIALVAACILFALLYAGLQKQEARITYIEVAMATKELEPNHKIAEEDFKMVKMPADNSENLVKDASITNKYVKDRIYEGEMIRQENIKKAAEAGTVKPATRTVRIITNVASSAGVGKGDKFDLIYVGKIGSLETVGKYFYQGLEVKRVLNKSGVDLEAIVADKYNQVDQEPAYIDTEVLVEEALAIETLQNDDNNICFKIAAWVDGSSQVDDPGYRFLSDLILGEEADKVMQQLQGLDKNSVLDTSKSQQPNVKIKSGK